MRNYYTYILTNKTKTLLYTGVTNDLNNRLLQHKENAQSGKTSFVGKYNCYYLLYFETFSNVRQAIAREKEIKGWTRKRKIDLIRTMNENMNFLSE